MGWDKSDQNQILMTLPPLGHDDEGEVAELRGSLLIGGKRSQRVGASQHGGCIHQSASWKKHNNKETCDKICDK